MNKEYAFVSNMVESAPRSKEQLNSLYLSDAEVQRVGDGYLCASVDTISEEISLGLIRDPHTLGWLTGIVSFSDLAAIGVRSKHLSVTLVKSPAFLKDSEQAFLEGVRSVCNHYNAQLDEYQSLENSQQTIITSTASCFSKEEPRLRRTSLRAGDSLYLTGPLGLGNVVAFANVALRSTFPSLAEKLDRSYRPQARIREALFFQKYANVCLDTSDGGLFSFDLLSALNHIGLVVDYSTQIFHPLALEIAKTASVNPFVFFAAQNGEFELLFSIPENKEDEFLKDCQKNSFSFLKVGRVVKTPGLCLQQQDQLIPVDMAPLENLLYDRVSPDQYILALMQFASSNNLHVGT